MSEVRAGDLRVAIEKMRAIVGEDWCSTEEEYDAIVQAHEDLATFTNLTFEEAARLIAKGLREDPVAWKHLGILVDRRRVYDRAVKDHRWKWWRWMITRREYLDAVRVLLEEEAQ